MAGWHCTEEQVDKYFQKVVDWIENPTDSLEFDNTDMSPMQLREILEEIGYISIEAVTNGWEQDRWEYFEDKDGIYPSLCMISCGLAFELCLTLRN